MVCDHNLIITECKKNKKIHVFEISISKNWLEAPSLDDILLESFTLPNSIISVKDLIRWKRGFEMFLIDYYAGDIGNNNVTGKH